MTLLPITLSGLTKVQTRCLLFALLVDVSTSIRLKRPVSISCPSLSQSEDKAEIFALFDGKSLPLGFTESCRMTAFGGRMCDTVLDIDNVYCGTVCDVPLLFFLLFFSLFFYFFYFFLFLKSNGRKELWNRVSVMYGFMNKDRNCGTGSG